MGATIAKRWKNNSPLDFKVLVEGSASVYELYKKLGYSGNGDRATIEARVRACRDYGIYISTSHFDSNGRGSLPEVDAMVHNENRKTRSPSSILRGHMLAAGMEESCDGCGLGTTWNGKRLVLDIDHISGNSKDNRLENLRFLCANCHKQEDTSSQNAHAAWILHHIPEAVLN